jgi:hypothetical protein
MITISGEDPRLRKELADFVIHFSTIEHYFTHLAYRCIHLSETKIDLVKVATMDLSKKRGLVKQTVSEKFNSLFPQWDKVNNELGKLNYERKFLIHTIGLLNITKDYFESELKINGKSKRYYHADIHELNERINAFLQDSDGLMNFFSEFDSLYQKEIKTRS